MRLSPPMISTVALSLPATWCAAATRSAVALRSNSIVFNKLQLVMFFEDIRSERHSLKNAAGRLSVRRYLGYDLGLTPADHSSPTRICDRIGLGGFRRFFDALVAQCVAAGKAQGRDFSSTAPRSPPMRPPSR